MLEGAGREVADSEPTKFEQLYFDKTVFIDHGNRKRKGEVV